MFGNKLKEARLEKDMTLDEVAEIYNKRYDGKLNKSTLSRYENGLQEPMLSVAMKLANVLGVSVDYLLDKKEANDNFITFPVVVGVRAGYGNPVYIESGDMEQIPKEWIKGDVKNNFFVARVQGDSMYPMFLDGDRVLVHITPSIDSGSIAVMRYNEEELTLKRIVYKQGEDWFEMQPINPAYPPKRIEGQSLEESGVIGEVKRLIRKF